MGLCPILALELAKPVRDVEASVPAAWEGAQISV